MIEYKNLGKFVLSPGARFYKTMCSGGLCTSPEELADLLSLEYGVDRQKVLDFLYDRGELNRNIVRMIFQAIW